MMENTVVAPPESGTPEELLNFDDALKFLGTSKTTLYRLLEQGDIKGTRVGRQWRFLRTDLLAYMERGPVATVAAPAEDASTELRFFAQELEREGGEVPQERPELTDNGERRTRLLADSLLALAIKAGASDIHLEPEKSALYLRLRLSGVLHRLREMPPSLAESLTVCFKQMADMHLTERRVPQDGRFPMNYMGKDYDIRVSCLPSLGGESIVMRILDRSSVLIGVDKLGMHAQEQDRLGEWLQRTSGMIIVTGPTGSGKSTLLYSCLHQINRPEIKILTVEDPVEYQLSGVRQVPVNRKVGMTYSAGLRSMLRQDPDAIMVAEMRDRETAEIAVESALTGHLLLTALHTEDSPSALERLRDIGIEPFLIAATVRGVIAQRLVRKICPHCKAPDEVTATENGFEKIRQLSARGGFPVGSDATFFAGQGCAHCRNTGYLGRTGLFEMLTITPEIMDAFKTQQSPDRMLQIAVAQGTRTLLADGIRKASEGITTLDEVLRVVGIAQ